MFESLNLTTAILWRKPLTEKGLSSADIRQYMAMDQPWEHLVPPAVARIMKDLGLVERIKKLMRE
jgi:hypothetical protein